MPQGMLVRMVYREERVSWDRLAFLVPVEKKASMEIKVNLDSKGHMEFLGGKVSVESITRIG